MSEGLFIVGKYIESFNILTSQDLPCGPIYQSSGLITHVKEHHPDEVSLLEHISEIISRPDFVGKHPKEPQSVELVKILNRNVMVCVKLDIKRDYFYVASVFSISDSKLRNRINSGRLRPFTDIDNIENTGYNIDTESI